MAHATQIGYATVWQVKAADGSIMWEGSAIIGQAFEVVNGGAANQPAWYPGTPIIATSVTTIGHPWNVSTADAIDNSLVGTRVASAASVGFLGVGITRVASVPATLPVAPPYFYPRGIVASIGSIVPVNMVSATGAVGAPVGGSATAALAGVSTPAVTNLTFGIIIKAAADLGATAGYNDGTIVHGRFSAGVLVAVQ